MESSPPGGRAGGPPDQKSKGTTGTRRAASSAPSSSETTPLLNVLDEPRLHTSAAHFVQMDALGRTEMEFGRDCLRLVGPQLDSSDPVRMTCKHRRDGGPTRFYFMGRCIEATVEALVDTTQRGLTTIGDGAVSIRQVEHILSALYGMACPDTDILLEHIEATERTTIAPPIAHLDAQDFTVAIKRSFLNRSGHRAVELTKAEYIRDDSDERDPSFAIVAPFGKGLRITVHLNFPYFWGSQIAACDVTPSHYESEVCWARSFFGTPFPHKAEWKELRERFPGLIAARDEHFLSFMIDYDSQKWLTPLRRDDEPARHKLLDVIGDLALVGVNLNASIYIYKPHHAFNRKCARRLRQALKASAI